MKRTLLLLFFAVWMLRGVAAGYSYGFDNTPLSQALVTISKGHPEITLNFIYDELESYTTSARIDTDDPWQAIRQAVGLNPVTVVRKKNSFYVEALQHGRYLYSGRVAGPEGEPVVSATVMLLAPADSTVITYGITDDDGRFAIPCDSRGVVAKFSCLGYRTVSRKCADFAVGTVEMPRLPVRLKDVEVTPEYAALYSDRSVFIPTARQKNSAQTGGELLNRMAIPQLRVGSGEEVLTSSGKPVDIFIDFVPASQQDLTTMRMADVRKVEYYDFPADPRFLGKQHVVNFIMQQYEYGGYVKGYADWNLFANSGQLTASGKFQYRRMTYDLSVGGYMMNSDHNYTDVDERFRLPQPDGTVKELTRITATDDAKLRRRDAWVTFKAMYKTDNVVMSNLVSTSYDGTPHRDAAGTVSVTPGDATTFRSLSDTRERSVAYNGYWNFILPKGNTLTFTPQYYYSYTTQGSSYLQGDAPTIRNFADDHSHQLKADLVFTHSFGDAGTLKAMCQGYLLDNNTSYTGNTVMSDRARTWRLGPGVSYSVSTGKFYGNVGLGLHYDHATYGPERVTSTAPWADLALQYAFDKRNSAGLEFHFHKSIPSASYRSAAVIQANPLMSYTGNPSLRPYKSFDIGVNYTFIPSRVFSASLFGWSWIVSDRYAYNYEASATGVLRTIVQPGGLYAQGQYGANFSLRPFGDSFQAGASIYDEFAHNGWPYNWTRHVLCWSLSAYYYLGDFYFGADYTPSTGYPDGCMVGTWMDQKSRYSIHAGWASRGWNVRVYACDFARWNWLSRISTMESDVYSTTGYIRDTGRHCFIKLSATYTFGFGRKVEVGSDLSRQGGAASGILK